MHFCTSNSEVLAVEVANCFVATSGLSSFAAVPEKNIRTGAPGGFLWLGPWFRTRSQQSTCCRMNLHACREHSSRTQSLPEARLSEASGPVSKTSAGAVAGGSVFYMSGFPHRSLHADAI